MHMADALISPAVGGSMWAASGGLLMVSGRRLQQNLDEQLLPLMGVLGAFIFAAQMINFSIPATGSSGHLGGGMILAILLGPYAAFLAMASVLTVQALFFADGGLLALGCNLFNLGFFPCFVAYPLVYRRIAGRQPTPRRILLGSLAASILALEMGALAVVLQTTLSGISELPFRGFLLLMLPVHLAIGIIEGLATAGVVTFVWKARPEVLSLSSSPGPSTFTHPGLLLVGLLALTALTGGTLSWFASSHPDGLEWSVFHASGREDLAGPEKGPLVALLGRVQEKTAFLPDYGFKDPDPGPAGLEGNAADQESWPVVSAGTSLAGIVGALITLALVGLIGTVLRRYHLKV